MERSGEARPEDGDGVDRSTGPAVPPDPGPDPDPERRFWTEGVRTVAGVDEVGRGPLAGPVVAAAVVLPPFTQVEGAQDSKALRPEHREDLERAIRSHALAVGVGAASAREIERLNVLVATCRAMDRALRALAFGSAPLTPERVVVDGPRLPHLPWDHEAVVGGDGRVHSVSCASVVAKVIRDRLMDRLAGRYPQYGWERNAGYGTPEHLQALDREGPTPHHRRTFSGVQPRLDLGA